MLNRLLAIVAHPDDETIGAGGYIHRVSRQGVASRVLALTCWGDTRLEEMQAACGRLGAKAQIGPWDGYERDLSSLSMLEIIECIDKAIQHQRPDTVLIPSYGAHQDHRIVRDACMAALRPSAGTGRHRPPVVLAMEHPADAWWGGPEPTFTVELSADDLVAKLEAMECYASQMRPQPSERSARAMTALAALRGAQQGCDFAEGYHVIRWHQV